MEKDMGEHGDLRRRHPIVALLAGLDRLVPGVRELVLLRPVHDPVVVPARVRDIHVRHSLSLLVVPLPYNWAARARVSARLDSRRREWADGLELDRD